jgi:hypothetical protein
MAAARSRRGGEELGERPSGGGHLLDRRYEGPEILARTRRHDRYANVQSELSEWSQRVPAISPIAEETLAHLCFELHEIFDTAFGDRLSAVPFRALEEADASAAKEQQPDVLAYVAECLDEAEDEGFPGEDRAEVERRAGQAVVALAAAVRAR